MQIHSCVQITAQFLALPGSSTRCLVTSENMELHGSARAGSWCGDIPAAVTAVGSGYGSHTSKILTFCISKYNYIT